MVSVIATMCLVLGVLLLSAAAEGDVGGGVPLVRGSKGQAVIVWGPAATEIEKHAAAELQRYVQAVTGASLPIISTDEAAGGGDRAWVLIGRAETNPAIASLVQAGKISLSAENPGLDGFVIQSTAVEGRPVLVLGGSRDRATLYAVYDLLERYVGVGFFWDGEQVPRAADLVLPPISVSSRPHFRVREYLQGCIFTYSARWWVLEDWKRQIDWAAKHKINQLYLAEPFLCAVPLKRTMAAFGVDMGPTTAEDEAQTEFCREVIDYARSLGIETISPVWVGSVSPALVEAHPEARYVKIQWLDFAPRYSIFPADPLFKKVGVTFIREYNALFGTSHIYCAEPYGETRPGADEQEQNAIKADFARVAGEMIAEADPEGTWVCTTWTFRDKEFWPKETVRVFMDAVPNDRFLVGDLWCEERPTYKELDYFWGRRWGFGVLHSFGGNTNLHGDMADLVRRAKEVVGDARASRCEAFQIMPEVVEYNHLYYDLATRLAWDPAAVDLNAFLEDYARRRYGGGHARRMSFCLKALAHSVLGWNDLIPPLYQVRPRTDWAEEGLPERLRCIGGTRKALDMALECADGLGDSPLYGRDVVDIAKEYLAMLYGRHFLWLLEAQEARDGARLEKESEVLLALLDDVERILASDPACHLGPLIERARRAPGRAGDVGRELRQIFTTLGSYESLLDYARRDFHELLRYYYRPRVERYLAAAKEALAAGATSVEEAVVDKQAREIAQRFIEEGYPEEPIRGYDSLAVVREIAERWPLSGEERGEGARQAAGEAEKGEMGPQHKPWDTAVD